MKRFLLAGVLSFIGVAPSLVTAQVTSINAVGYANVVCQPGFNLLANPLAAASMDVPSLFPSASIRTTIYKYDGAGFVLTRMTAGGWSLINGTNMTINPGEGVFYYNPDATPTTITFVGEVLTGTLNNPVPSGFSIRSSQVPQSGGVTTVLSLQLDLRDSVYRLNTGTGGYDVYRKTGSNPTDWFASNEPQIQVGEAFWIFRYGAPTTWARQFSIN